MEKTELGVVNTITEGINIGIKNLPSLVVASICFILTLWVPYINVGTAIAMNSIPGHLAKGDSISPFFIYDEQYRRDFSAYFLLYGFMSMVKSVGYCFVIIPGIVISIALSLATYILVDFDATPTDAMKLSNRATYGYKWNIFFIGLIKWTVICLGFVILYSIGSAISASFAFILILAGIACVMPISLGIDAVIYKSLYLDLQEESLENQED